MSKLRPVLNEEDPIAPGAVAASHVHVAPMVRAPAAPHLRVVSADEGAAELVVEWAARFVRANIGRRLRVADLVAGTGVSDGVLRGAVETQTGRSLRHFILTLRLDQARAWLSSERELRSLREIAAALGCKYLGELSRTYGERFGESMIETRRRAVLASAAPKYRASNAYAHESVIRVSANIEGNDAEQLPLK